MPKRSVYQSQNDLILAHLKAGNPIDPMRALVQFNCLRLGARIYDLREAGHNILTSVRVLPSGKRVAEYRMLPK